eukprot:1226738-Pyramimonas_sp.AAC.1
MAAAAPRDNAASVPGLALENVLALESSTPSPIHLQDAWQGDVASYAWRPATWLWMHMRRRALAPRGCLTPAASREIAA